MFESMIANINKLIDIKLNKFKTTYRQDLAKTGINKQAHIADADGTLPDITTKFNTLLDACEENGIIKKS